jgi:hypothetical protein
MQGTAEKASFEAASVEPAHCLLGVTDEIMKKESSLKPPLGVTTHFLFRIMGPRVI